MKIIFFGIPLGGDFFVSCTFQTILLRDIFPFSPKRALGGHSTEMVLLHAMPLLQISIYTPVVHGSVQPHPTSIYLWALLRFDSHTWHAQGQVM